MKSFRRIPGPVRNLLLGTVWAFVFYESIKFLVRAALALSSSSPIGVWLGFIFWSSGFFFLSAVLLLLIACWTDKDLRGSLFPGNIWGIGLFILPSIVMIIPILLIFGGPSQGRFSRSQGRFSLSPLSSLLECRGGRCITEKTNRLGFRGPLLDPQKKPSVKRIIFVGDSCTYGSGLYEPEMIDAVLLKQIRAAGPRCEWEAGNFAVPGLNIFSYVRMLRSIVPIFSPDYVVIGVQGGSELAPDYWDQLDGYSPFLWELASRFSYTGRVAMVELEYGRRRLKSGLPAGISSRLADSLRQLLILQRERGFRLVLLRFEKNYSGFLRDLEGQNGVSFVDAPEHWARDPALIVPNDGHPSAKANSLFSSLIVNEILKDNAGCVLEEKGG